MKTIQLLKFGLILLFISGHVNGQKTTVDQKLKGFDGGLLYL